VEDAGGIGSTTQTLAYDSIGRAIEVQDASGKQFQTNYDLDGVIQSVYRVDGGNQMIASYTYGNSGITNGQPTQIQDGLSGVTQAIGYATSGGGLGLPSGVTETNGSDSYSVAYTYSAAGDRATASYTTPVGTVNWGYTDYIGVGPAPNGSRVFRTVNRLDSNMNPTGEEFHYQFDMTGRLRQAAFAQTPYTGFTPNTGSPWYDATHPAQSRARAYYDYDAAGRLVTLNHWGDNLQSNGTYTSTAVLGNTCTYDPMLGLKTSSSFWVQNPQNPSAFLLSRTESYGYDPALDYLTSASYNDGQPNANPQWSYDAAGNRTDSGSTFDNLNRATAIQGTSCTNDILGNRTGLGSTISYGWDSLNRMTSYSVASETMQYAYRADGMRVAKLNTSAGGSPVTHYRYDGQMGMEDATWTVGSGWTSVTRYGLGARGIDYMENPAANGGWTAFPVYDAHGNMVATLARSGNNSYSLGNQRSFDAWGSVRLGAQNGDPSGRYCGQIGHKQDDESGLIYMRARYYEQGSGRFINQDPDQNGHNWFSYCGCDPVNYVDGDGKDLTSLLSWLSSVLWCANGYAAMTGQSNKLKAFLGIITGFVNAVTATMRLIQAAAAADNNNGSPLVLAAQMGAIMCLKAFAIVYLVANLNWWLLLNSDPDATLPQAVYGG
jgi:RHS repeat-associated protein